MHIVGTAGHVDHGKSSLVIALTGHDPDRLLEERQRGMTLDLGFAPLRFDDGVEAGIVDVPGHERFVHNMLAGAAGMELLLLVIAANEGPRPQTLEHLRILDFLDVQRAIVVLTKSDLTNESDLELAAELARDACRGSVADGAPIVAVSCVSGKGIDELRSAIHAALVALAPRRPDAPAFMPVDRVFALPGHGTIVTGTLMQGTIRKGDALALQPSGIETRARSVQVFGRAVDAAAGGSRVAVNLPGVQTSAVARGDTLVAVRAFEPAADLVVEFLPRPEALALLRRRTRVRAHIGAAEILGLLIFEPRPPHDAAPSRARLALAHGVAFYPNGRFVVRRMSPKDLLGGGIIVAASESTVLAGSASEALSTSYSGGAVVLGIITDARLRPLSIESIAARANIKVEAAREHVRELVESGVVTPLAKPIEYVSHAELEAAFQKAADRLRARHAAAPWTIGCDAGDIARALSVDDGLARRLLDVWLNDGRLGQRGHYFCLPDIAPAFTNEQRAFFASQFHPDSAAPLVPRSYAEVARAIASTRIAGVAEAFDSLVTSGGIVRIGDDAYLREQIDRAKAMLVELLRRGDGATMAQVRDALGTSRKYALPLMEYFDGIGFTLRDGDLRRLRKPALAHSSTRPESNSRRSSASSA